MAADAAIEVSLFARPFAAWDTVGHGAQRLPAGSSPPPRAARSRSSPALDDCRRAAAHGFRAF